MSRLTLRLIIQILAIISIASCTLNIGGPSNLPDAPAPTAVPLAQDAVSLDDVPGKSIVLPPGFAISVFADGLDGPRMMTLGTDGQVYVAERGAGKIIRLPDADLDGRADAVETLAEGLAAPSSLVFYKDGSMYVGETTRILRFPPLDGKGSFEPPQVVIDGLPSGGHNTRTVLFSPNFAHLLVSIGSSCNVCEEDDQRRAAIMRYNPDGSAGRVYADGLRNSVGMTIRPGTDQLWVTNNGRDFLGDDLPPETVYRVQEGGHYGWPYCHSGRIIDPQFGSPSSCQDVEAPMVEMQAHSAPLGLEFYSGDAFPTEYQGDLFVAFHGSWNRSQPVGYKIVSIPLAGNAVGDVEDFAAGWLEGGGSWGRPVDVLTAADGSLLVSDDAGGRIFRIYYAGN